jgi:endonuclease III
MDEKSRAGEIFAILKKEYPDAKIALTYGNNWELLVATELSAQCTDKKVNEVTPALFKKYPTVADYAMADSAEFEKDIHSTGFYHNKTKNILGAARMVLSDYGGEIPNTMAEIIKLPGVARKTANIVLGNAFGVVNGIAVDTHVLRLSHRLGFTDRKTPEQVERDLMALLPPEEWFKSTYLLIEHGRNVCAAKKARCDICAISGLCPSAFKV